MAQCPYVYAKDKSDMRPCIGDVNDLGHKHVYLDPRPEGNVRSVGLYRDLWVNPERRRLTTVRCPYRHDHGLGSAQCLKNDSLETHAHGYEAHGVVLSPKADWNLPEGFAGTRLTPLVIEADKSQLLKIFGMNHVHNTLGKCLKSLFTPEGYCPVVGDKPAEVIAEPEGVGEAIPHASEPCPYVYVIDQDRTHPCTQDQGHRGFHTYRGPENRTFRGADLDRWVRKTETEKEDSTVSVTTEPKYRAVVYTLNSYKKRLSHESAEYDKVEDASAFISMIANRGVPVIEARIETSDVVTTISRGEWKPF